MPRRVIAANVTRVRRKHGVHLSRGRRGPRLVEGHYTVRELAEAVGTDPWRLYRALDRGQLDRSEFKKNGRYLFPTTRSFVDQIRRLIHEERK